MTPVQLSISQPCSENFSDFTPTPHGGFCSACNKDVINFTTWTDQELIQWLSVHKQRTGICGRLRDDQLKTFVIDHRHPRKCNGLTAVVLVLMTMLLSRPATAQEKKESPIVQLDTKPTNDTLQTSQRRWMIVSGIVTINGAPIVDVTVTRKGTTQTTLTDTEGRYKLLLIKPGDHEVLEFECGGYIIKHRHVYTAGGERQVTNVAMQRVVDPIQMLQGRMGGVSIAPARIPRTDMRMEFWWLFK